ncbi:hypothetical protein FK178_10485 [Antarcticibacterium arcticum]|uniref:Uncharacterized protein n=1 Tax=Antarcticibacterium arcticum TaxID=2585771 RepID=A0A5B8YNB8_9FLAO|nr:hypothetical protein [Antarcticibacterium arcticum]QED38123.1 hypothetical protein FK178_10485 [Antarcticibacterium arcticum]
MRLSGIFYLIATTILLVVLTVMAFYEVSFYLIFYLTLIGQLLLIFTVYKILTDDYTTKKKFKDWYEDHPIGREKR